MIVTLYTAILVLLLTNARRLVRARECMDAGPNASVLPLLTGSTSGGMTIAGDPVRIL